MTRSSWAELARGCGCVFPRSQKGKHGAGSATGGPLWNLLGNCHKDCHSSQLASFGHAACSDLYIHEYRTSRSCRPYTLREVSVSSPLRMGPNSVEMMPKQLTVSASLDTTMPTSVVLRGLSSVAGEQLRYFALPLALMQISISEYLLFVLT